MLRLSIEFFCHYIFREESSLIDFLTENTHKLTLKDSQKTHKILAKNIHSFCVLNLNFR